MVMISSYIQPNTIVNDDFSHSSFLKTVCDKWGLDPLTDRDKNAQPFTSSNLFSAEKHADWPVINMDAKVLAKIKMMSGHDLDDDPLNSLQKSILNGLLYVEKKRGLVPTPKELIKTNGDMRVLLDRLL